MSRTLNQAGHGATDECAARHGPRITANDLTELGIYVIALALFYGSLGIILFFDRGLLAFSNVRCLWYSVFSHLQQLLFLFGFLLAMGLRASATFYLTPSRCVSVRHAVFTVLESLKLQPSLLELL